MQAQLAVARRNVDNQRETLKLTETRLEAGRSTELDTARAGSQLSTTLATIGPLEAEVARAIHRLAVLTGREPNALDGLLAPARELPELPQISAVGDPAGLLRRRPDIRVAERELAASTARVGVAVGDLFPKVSFNGSFTYAGTEPASLGSSARLVVACGGGTYANDESRRLIDRMGRVVWIQVPLAQALARCEGGPARPLLQGGPQAEALYRKRLPSYRAATLHVDADGLSAEDVAERIAGLL